MLFDLLSQYNDKGVIPLHMPGHKRNTAMLGDKLPYGIDITEIDGFDNLHDAHGVIKATADLAVRLYGSRRAFLLVNGSTGGLLAAVRAAARRGETVIMARNCHKAVYNAVELQGLRPVYLVPPLDPSTGICGSLRPQQVETALQAHPEAKLVIITSPTYEGVVSDVGGICRVAHKKDIPVLVDAAHGAHFGFSDYFPQSPVTCGADIVITSLHKTLPALTQCALALVSGSLIDDDKLASALAVFQTSSPSYVLMSSIDSCLRLLDREGPALFDTYTEHLMAFDKSVQRINKLKILCHGADTLSNHDCFFDVDPGKIVISTRGTKFTGTDLARLLRTKYRMELEMASCDYALAMTSVCDGWDTFALLVGALLDMNRDAECVRCISSPCDTYAPPRQTAPADAVSHISGVPIVFHKAAGLMSLEYVWAYPPGIPYVVPGEMIDEAFINLIKGLTDSGVAVHSSKGGMPHTITVVQTGNNCL